MDIISQCKSETKYQLCDKVVLIMTEIQLNNRYILFWKVSVFSTSFCSNPTNCDVSVCHRECVSSQEKSLVRYDRQRKSKKKSISNNWLSQRKLREYGNHVRYDNRKINQHYHFQTWYMSNFAKNVAVQILLSIYLTLLIKEITSLS